MAGGTKYVDLITFILDSSQPTSSLSYANIFGYLGMDNIILSANGLAYQAIGQIQSAPGMYGDGYDGDMVFDGYSTVILGDGTAIGPIGSTYTMPRDIYARSITILPGVTVSTACFRVFCRGELHNDGLMNPELNNGSINGGNGSTAQGGLGGVVGLSGTLALGFGGGAGSSNGAGTAGSAAANGVGGSGGDGGSGSGGAGGTGGIATPPAATEGGYHVTQSYLGIGGQRGGTAGTGYLLSAAGGGGGGGTTGGVGGGGGGGSGGSSMQVLARAITGSGAIRSDGGNGGNACDVVGSGGGGGGGGGGYLTVVTEVQPTVILSANGGIGGLGRLTGVNGSNGAAGQIALMVRQ